MSDGKLFVTKWENNGDDLLEHGVYDLACEMLKPYEKVLEIGCGTGHSTLALLLNAHKVFAIDVLPECIAETAERVSDIGYEEVSEMKWTDKEATLMCANLFDPMIVRAIMNLNVDTIIIWNPGQADNIKLVDQCAFLARAKNIPLQVMERERTKEEAHKCLKDIADYNSMRLVDDKIVMIEWNQELGIKLLEINDNIVYESIGMYYPF